MRRIHFLRGGNHTDSHGTAVDFGEDTLRGIAADYDPAVHEAPLVVGHPRDNGPAFGWVQAVEHDAERGLYARPHQVNADFADMVQAGQFKKVSASLYTPEHPNNPKPGSYYLRHIGFLGAQPPAIKGLEPIAFSDDDGLVIELTEDAADFMDGYHTGVLARLFRNLREWIVDKHSTDDADKVVPGYLVEDLEDAARRPPPESPAAAFSEPAAPGAHPDEDTDMPPTDDAAAREAEFAERQATLDAREASFAEREAAIAAREAELTRQQHAAWVDGMVAKGKVLPAARDGMVAFMCSLGTEATVEFSEGKKLSPLDAYKAEVAARPKAVELGEVAHDAGDDAAAGRMTPAEVGERAREFREAEAAKGRIISFTAAVAAVRSGKAA